MVGGCATFNCARMGTCCPGLFLPFVFGWGGCRVAGGAFGCFLEDAPVGLEEGAAGAGEHYAVGDERFDELLEGVASGGGFDGVDAFDEPVEARTNGGVGDAVDFRELLERAGGEQETFQE